MSENIILIYSDMKDFLFLYYADIFHEELWKMNKL